MKRADLIKSREYWIAEIQLQLFSLIENYRTKHKLTKTQIAEKLGVTKSYITQVLNGDFDHKMSKLVDLSLAFGKVPVIHFVDADQYIRADATPPLKIHDQDSKPVEYDTYINHQTAEVLNKYIQPSGSLASKAPYALGNHRP